MNYINTQPTRIVQNPTNRGLNFDPERLVAESPLYNSVENTFLRTSSSAKKKPGYMQDPILDGTMTDSPIIHRPDSEYIPWNDQPRSSNVYSPVKQSQPRIVSSFIPDPEPVNPQKPPSFSNSLVAPVNNNLRNSNVNSKFSDLIKAMNNPKKFQTGFDSCKFQFFNSIRC